MKAMTWAWEQDLKQGPKFVLVALADHSDGCGVCWPGHELIAEKCGISRQTVVEHIGLLESMGMLRAERTRADGREGKTRYFLNLKRLSTQPPESEKPTLANVGIPDAGDGSRVGISDDPESGFPIAYKEEPKAIEPKTKVLSLFEAKKPNLDLWFGTVFWTIYPKKHRKPPAQAQLHRLHPDEQLLEAIAAGLQHRIAAEIHAKAKGAFFPAWPDPHRWLRERRWEERFDVPRETTSGPPPACACGSPAVMSDGRRWYCAGCEPGAVSRAV